MVVAEGNPRRTSQSYFSSQFSLHSDKVLLRSRSVMWVLLVLLFFHPFFNKGEGSKSQCEEFWPEIKELGCPQICITFPQISVALAIHIHVCNGFYCRHLTLATYVDYVQQFQMRMIVSLGLLKMSFERAYLLTLYFTEEEIGVQRNQKSFASWWQNKV